MKKRTLIALLACMTLSAGAGVATLTGENTPFTTITASADSVDTVAALTAGGTVTLNSDVVLTERVTIKKDTILDLNGFSISGAVADNLGMLYVGTTGILTIKGEGSITNTAGIAIGNYGMVTVEGGAITGEYALYNFNYAPANGATYGTAVIKGGVFDTNAATDGLAIANCGKLTINGGEFKATIDTTRECIVTHRNSKISTLLVKDPDYETGALEPKTSVYNVVDTTNLEVILQSSKDAMKTNYYLGRAKSVEGAVAGDSTNGKYYATLQGAIDDAESGAEVRLNKNITVDEQIVIDKDLTILGGVHTITSTMTAQDNRIIDIPKTVANAQVTIKNLTIVGSGEGAYSRGVNYNSNGTLTLDNVTIKNIKYYAVNLPKSGTKGANVIVKNSDITGWSAINVWGEGATVSVEDSTLTSHWFKVNESEDFGALVVNNKNTTVNVKNTTFKKTGYETELYFDVYLQKQLDGCTASNTTINADTELSILAEATVDGAYYASFVEAYTAAATAVAVTGQPQTIVLQKDYEVDFEENTYVDLSGLTLDLNGHTVTVPFKSMLLAGNNFTVKNGTVDSDGADYGLWIGANAITTSGVTVENVKVNGGINIHNADGVTLKNVTADASAQDYYAVWVEYDAKNVAIESGSYTAGTAGKAVNASKDASVEIQGGAFSDDVSKYCVDGYLTAYNESTGTYEFKEKFTYLEDEIKALKEALAEKETEIASLQTALTALQATVGGNSTVIAQLQAALEEKAAEIVALNSNVDSLKNNIQDNADEIADLAGEVATLETELTNMMNKAVSDLKDELQALITANADDIAALQTALTNLQTTVGGNSAAITQLQTKLNEKAAEIAQLKTDLEALSDLLDENAEDIKEIIESVTEFHDDYVEFVSTKIPALKAELQALITKNANDITTLKNALTALGDMVDSNADDIAALKEALNNLDGNTDTKISDLQAQITAINNTIKKLNKKIVNLETRLQNKIDANTQKINELQDALTAKITANESEIAALQEALNSQANDTSAKLEALRVALTEKIEKNATDIAALQAALEEEVATLTASIEALGAKADAHAQKLAEIAAWQTEYAAKVAANAKAITTLQSDLDAAEAKIANLEKLQAALQTKVTEIEALQTALSATVASNGEAIEALQTALNAKVTELKGLLTEVNAEIDGNAASIKSLKAAVEAEIATIEAWQEAFDKKVAANKVEIEKLQAQVADLEEKAELLDSDNSVLLAVTIIAIAFSLTALAVSSIMWVKKLEEKDDEE